MPHTEGVKPLLWQSVDLEAGERRERDSVMHGRLIEARQYGQGTMRGLGEGEPNIKKGFKIQSHSCTRFSDELR
jgi:hypothetical protein